MIKEDVERSFALPLPIEILHYIPNASIAPLGCQEQMTINASGDRVPKFRLTHDQSFPGPSGNSTNLQVQQDKLPHCKYGHCLCHIINYIASIRISHPTTPIFLSKYDFDAAFCRCHMSPETALESCCSIDGLLLISL